MSRHRYNKTPVYWRFTYRYYRHYWWRQTWQSVTAELSDAYATLKLLLK